MFLTRPAESSLFSSSSAPGSGVGLGIMEAQVRKEDMRLILLALQTLNGASSWGRTGSGEQKGGDLNGFQDKEVFLFAI